MAFEAAAMTPLASCPLTAQVSATRIATAAKPFFTIPTSRRPEFAKVHRHSISCRARSSSDDELAWVDGQTGNLTAAMKKNRSGRRRDGIQTVWGAASSECERLSEAS